ncbi:MAG: helix-turn-helix domain-containing protein [Anaeromyxobacter sp.]
MERSRVKKRVRRSPEEARLLLLEAAEALVAARGPDAVTLRDVAERVGVTPGLVTHYFGTYAGLVRAVLRRQDALTAVRLRAELDAGAHVPDADMLIGALFAALADPTRVRLLVWAHLRGVRTGPTSRGLAAFVDGLEAAFQRTLPPARQPPRARIEGVVLLALSATHGWAIGKEAWLGGLGAGPPTAERDEAFRIALTRVLRRYMAEGA